MKKRLKKLSVIVAITAFFALALTAGFLTPSTVNAAPVEFAENETLREEYGQGYTLTIPAVPVTVGNLKLQSGAVLYLGSTLIDELEPGQSEMRVRLTQIGKYTLTYYCFYEGKYYTSTYNFEVKDKPYFQYTLAKNYKLGEDLPVSATAVYNGETKAATVKVNGEQVSEYRIKNQGNFTVEYLAEFGGETYTESSEITVAVGDYADLFSVNKSSATITANADMPACIREEQRTTGVRILSEEPGTVVRYGSIIDLREMTENKELLLFTPLSGTGYTPIEWLRVRVTDVYDSGNYFDWYYYNKRNATTRKCNTYCYVTYNSVNSARFPQGQSSGKFGEIDYQYGAIMSSWTFDVDYMSSWSETNATNRRLFAPAFNYTEKQAWTMTATPSLGQWLLLDLDNPEHVGYGNEWGGFTTGEVWLEFYFDGTASNSGIIVNEIAGQKLEGQFIDGTTAPTMFFEYGDDFPVGFAGNAYEVPLPLCVDDILDGRIDVSQVDCKVYKGVSGSDEVAVTDGKFTPESDGIYRIEYSVTNGAGQTGRFTARVNVEGAYDSSSTLIDCDFAQSAYVGQRVMLPEISISGMSTLVKREVGYYYNDSKLDNSFGDYVLLDKAGSLEVRYDLIDYTGNKESGSFTMNVTVSDKPIITVTGGMPYAAIRGNTLLLPDFTAYDYNYSKTQAGYTPRRSITVNGKSVSPETRSYKVTDADGRKLTVVYSAGTASMTFEIKVVDVSLLSSYFITESNYSVQPLNTEQYTGFRFRGGALTVTPISPVVINAFTGFTVGFDTTSGLGKIDYYMYDYERPEKYIVVHINKTDGTLTINDGVKEFTLDDGDISLTFRQRDNQLIGYGQLTTWADGTPFDGFSGDVAKISWVLSDFGSGYIDFYVANIGKTSMASKMTDGEPQAYNDNAVPTVVLTSNPAEQELYVGANLIIPEARAWMSLSGRCEVTVNVYSPEGYPVASGLNANTSHTYYIDQLGIWQMEYIMTLPSGQKRVFQSAVTVTPTDPPTATVLGNIEAVYKVGTTFYLPTVRVSGEGEIVSYWSLTFADGFVKSYQSGEGVTLNKAGVYYLTLIVYNEWHYTIQNYTFKVEG